MTDYKRFERLLVNALQLGRRPVAIAFTDTVPASVEKFEGTEPSGCSYWRLAGEGRVFYTVPSDHYNCPIGCYTHNIQLPADREQELSRVLSLMSDVGYIRVEEIPSIPRLPKTLEFAIYAPLGSTPVDPDVVMMSGKPGRLMLLHEAAARAVLTTPPMFGRPTCMAIPAALDGSVVSSLGCVGNRIYTGIDDTESYMAVAGRDLPLVVDQLATVLAANDTLAEYHRGRHSALATA